MKKIDLLKVTADKECRKLDARLGGEPAESAGRLFPDDFAATGFNGGIRFADLRFTVED